MTKFKQTEIGEIPEDWDVVKLGDNTVANIILGQSPPSSTYNKNLEGIPFLQGNADFGDVYPNPTTFTTNPIKISLKDDILISVRAPVGEVNLSTFKCCIGRGLSAIRTNPQKLLYLFTFYTMKHITTKLHALSTGSTFKAITKYDLDNFIIALPPLKEQQKIADVLSTVDFTIQKSNEIIQRTQLLKKSIMYKLLARGINHTKFKQTDIGEIPEKWSVVKLADVCTPRNEIVQPDHNGSGRFVGLEHVDPGNPKLTRYGLAIDVKSSKLSFYSGDILYGKLRPYLDKAVIVDFDGISSTDLIVLTPKQQINHELLIHIIHSSRFIQHANLTTTGTNHPRTSWNSLKEFSFGLPSLSEQQKMASIISEIDKKIELETKKKNKLEQIKQSLMNDLLTGTKRLN